MEFSTSYPSIVSPSVMNKSSSDDPAVELDSSGLLSPVKRKKWSSVPALTADRLQFVDIDCTEDRPRKSPPESPPSPPASPVHSSHRLPLALDTASRSNNLLHSAADQECSVADRTTSSAAMESDDGVRVERRQSRLSASENDQEDLIFQVDGTADEAGENFDIMTTSFDNNGNLLDEENQNEGGVVDQKEEEQGENEEKSPDPPQTVPETQEKCSRQGSVEEGRMNESGGGPKFQLGFKSHLQRSVEGFGEEPKYFINAAALSEDLDTYTMPSLESIGTLEECELATTRNNQGLLRTYSKEGGNNGESVTPTNGPVENENSNNSTANTVLPTVAVKPRVPMSKSFPDIIQTTFVDECRDFKGNKVYHHNEAMMLEKDASVNDLTADSLEDLPTKSGPDGSKQPSYHHQHHHHTHQHHHHYHNHGRDFDLKGETDLQDLMSMSQSQSQIGILAEKPPEAWVIDLNSLSLDSEAFEHSEMSSSIKSSNPSSLAYFIDMDEKIPEQTAKSQQQQKVKSPEKKKIFSMFVDFGGENERSGGGGGKMEEQQQQQHSVEGYNRHSKPSRLPVHRNVMNVLKEGEPMSLISTQSSSSKVSSSSGNNSYASSASSSSYTKRRAHQYPSPISQHKAAASSTTQASRNKAAAKIELLEATEKAKESREDHPPPMPLASEQNMEASTTSNRSSLHVATEFDMTFSSSFISSMETSGPEAEELCSKGPCFKLGKDLLRMFQDGINTDVRISVNGRILRAHKCILSSRSQYFAAIFSGQLLEKAGNTIELDGFSYTVVHFAMCHIYSGTNEIPDSIDLLELATLTDLLGLEGLRENISQTIRVKFCHNFHRPCTGCISGVLECLPIALSYEMDELHRKMIKWICKHFVRIWPTKAFANLGDDLIDRCLRYSINHLSVDNILDITLGCDQLLTTMPTVRWTEPIFVVVNQLSKACTQFIGENFSQVLQSQRFLLFGKGQQWNISRIEGTFVEAMTLLKPDEACLSHTALSRLIELGTETIDEVEWSTLFVDFLRMLIKEIERYLIANASKAVLSKYWESLGKDVQKRICQTSFLGYDKAGNKIVKGSTAAMTAKQANPGRLTPSERSSSITSIKSSLASKAGMTSGHGGRHEGSSSKGFGPSHHHAGNSSSTAKIASVRPIQNVFSTASNDANNQSSSTMPKSSSGHKARPQPTQLNRRKTAEEKEKSFSNSPRNSSVTSSSITSANRTPLNPLTPMTPNKPGPGLLGATTATTVTTATTPGTKSSTSSRATTRNSSNKPEMNTPTQPQQQGPPGKPGFITNSARANLVSKPNLRQRNVSSTTSRGNTPRTPNLSQPSRYASSLGITSRTNSGGTTTRHSQGSGSDRSERTSVAGTPNEPSSARVRTTRANTVSGGTRERSNLNKNTGSSAASGSSSSSSRKTSAKTRTNTTTTIGPAGSAAANSAMSPDPMRDSNVMSRSTIETESGETKIRTLAEIGRSSTFSKDEPTILGKLDPNQTVNIDFS